MDKLFIVCLGTFSIPSLVHSASDLDVLFLPSNHLIKTIRSDLYHSAETILSSLESLHLPKNDPLMDEVNHVKSDLINSIEHLHLLLSPSPSLTSRARRSIWNIFGLASTSDIYEAKKHIDSVEIKEQRIQVHMKEIDQNLKNDKAIVSELLRTNQLNQNLLVDKLRRLSIDISVLRLLRLLSEVNAQAQDHIKSALTGQLHGSLQSNTAQLSRVLSMSIVNDTVLTTAWSSDLRSVTLPVTKIDRCCTAVMPNNQTRSFECSSRVFPLRSVVGPDRATVCAITQVQALDTLQACNSLQPVKLWCPINHNVALGWNKPVTHLATENLHEIQYYPDQVSVSLANLKNYSFTGIKNFHNLEHIPENHYVPLSTFYIVIIPIAVLVLILTLILFSILVFQFVQQKDSAARAARIEIAMQSPPETV